ncbi:hypothetical protein BJ123_14228 [Rhodopseudomonas thermotolerans]|uniref:Uncharacterized protein n=2 Tax=Rhodopseudomonas TaxID=1073 RepID=A0A336JYS5_9BRAD|nr:MULTISPECIES: hypothetical protein [Rhodopseudomonas]RED22238.1 hypothetical protein BJ125_14228 [Rhodopseudomonas pentothenatexigens]REF88696.1 hypothetical protein BJ123_14228 [Rhodopseudomonas thermotolerans]SSW93566.1 hypothetical protein SAMN05892882_14228 [Rhodopseudomonas pentothenatexigens]
MSNWREEHAKANAAALARLTGRLPDQFPQAVLIHAKARRYVPSTLRAAVDSYWRAHPLRAERLARMLAARSGAPADWQWQLGESEAGLPATFRIPPAPYREKAYQRGPGFCCVCGQPVYRFGWHADLWQAGINTNATWHSACVTAWQFWNAPSGHTKLLRRLQGRRCRETNRRLLRTAEVDHLVPLFQVWRQHRDLGWPELLGYWGLPNLQVINREVHAAKCANEARDRRSLRAAAAVPA